jgi:hypothetical protein
MPISSTVEHPKREATWRDLQAVSSKVRDGHTTERLAALHRFIGAN